LDGRIELFFEDIGAGLELKPVRVLRRGFQALLDAGASLQQFGRCAGGRATAQMQRRRNLSKAGAGHPQVEGARAAVGLSQQAFGVVGQQPPGGEAKGDEQRRCQAGAHPEVNAHGWFVGGLVRSSSEGCSEPVLPRGCGRGEARNEVHFLGGGSGGEVAQSLGAGGAGGCVGQQFAHGWLCGRVQLIAQQQCPCAGLGAGFGIGGGIFEAAQRLAGCDRRRVGRAACD